MSKLSRPVLWIILVVASAIALVFIRMSCSGLIFVSRPVKDAVMLSKENWMRRDGYVTMGSGGPRPMEQGEVIVVEGNSVHVYKNVHVVAVEHAGRPLLLYPKKDDWWVWRY